MTRIASYLYAILSVLMGAGALFALASCSDSNATCQVEVEFRNDTTEWICLVVKEFSNREEVDTLRFTAQEPKAKISIPTDSLVALSVYSQDRLQYFEIPFIKHSTSRLHLDKAYPSLSYWTASSVGKEHKKFIEAHTQQLMQYDQAVARGDAMQAQKLLVSLRQALSKTTSNWSPEKKEENAYWTSLYLSDNATQSTQSQSLTLLSHTHIPASGAQDTLSWSLESYPNGRLIFVSEAWDLSRWDKLPTSTTDTLIWVVDLDNDPSAERIQQLPKRTYLLPRTAALPLVIGSLSSKGSLPKALTYHWNASTQKIRIDSIR